MVQIAVSESKLAGYNHCDDGSGRTCMCVEEGAANLYAAIFCNCGSRWV